MHSPQPTVASVSDHGGCITLPAGPVHRLDLAYPRIDLPKHDLAEYVGTSGRHLNRVLKQLAARGAIEVAPGKVRRIDPAIAMRIVDGGAIDLA